MKLTVRRLSAERVHESLHRPQLAHPFEQSCRRENIYIPVNHNIYTFPPCLCLFPFLLLPRASIWENMHSCTSPTFHIAVQKKKLTFFALLERKNYHDHNNNHMLWRPLTLMLFLQRKYERLVEGSSVLESSLHQQLIEHINAEVRTFEVGTNCQKELL